MIIIFFIIIIILFVIWKLYNRNKIWDFANIHYASPHFIITPTSTQEIIDVISSYPKHKISIAGGQYSHGGQTLLNGSIHINFKKFNRILSLNQNNMTVTVEAGVTWEQLINYLDKFNLSVSEMQSYSNFTIGGSISVNCHGRGLLYGTLADSLIQLKLLTTNGQLIDASIYKHAELFRAVIGGYGGIAIILHAVLRVCHNFPIERKIYTISRQAAPHFYRKIIADPDLIFYNGNIYPKNESEIINICWYRSQLPLTCQDRIQRKKSKYYLSMSFEQILRRSHLFKYVRAQFEPYMLSTKQVVWKNYEMSYDVNTLQPLIKFPTTSILQEYFLPLESLSAFLDYFWMIVNRYLVNLLNVSLRYVKKTDIPLLNYAPNDRIAIVLYLNIGNNTPCINYAKKWTRLLIQKSINLGGSYYLPYLPMATKLQFQSAYPEYQSYIRIKNQYDPMNRLSNQFIEHYLN